MIEKLEAQKREIDAIIDALRKLEGTAPIKPDGHTSHADYEKRLLEGALLKAKGNQSEASRLLKISRDQFRGKMKRFGMFRKGSIR